MQKGLIDEITKEIEAMGYRLTLEKDDISQRWKWQIGYMWGDGAHPTELDAAEAALKWLKERGE